MEKHKTLLRTNLLQFIPTTSLGFKIALPFAVAVTLLFIFWESVYSNHELIRNIGLVSAALIGFPMLIWRTRIADRQAATGEASHTTETYTKAIEQLGAKDADGKPSMELRLGGLYALENIAQSNDKYHKQIMEVLCAYVRMYALKPAKTPSANELQEMVESGDLVLTEGEVAPILDIQTALTIIGRRNADFDGAMRLDLNNTKLAGYNLTEANLIGADLIGVDLTRAKLRRTKLTDADLTGADLIGADLTRAKLYLSDLSEAGLCGAKLNFSDLTGANLADADLADADLTEADLTEADLTGANLTGADLTGADITEVRLLQTQIEGVEPESKYEELFEKQQEVEAQFIVDVETL